MVGEMFEIINESITSFVRSLSTGLTGISELFYNAESGFTFVGTLLLISVGVGLVYWSFRLIKNLISQRRA